MCRRVRGKGSETDGVADANALEGRQVASNSNYNKGIFIGSWILSYIAKNPIPVQYPFITGASNAQADARNVCGSGAVLVEAGSWIACGNNEVLRLPKRLDNSRADA